MKRFIVLCIIVLVSITFFSSALAEEETPFVFRNGITWGMSVAEVQEKEGNSLVPTLNHFALFNVDVSKFKANLLYYFNNDKLLMCDYSILVEYDECEDTMQYLISALASKYGDNDACSFSTLEKTFDMFYDFDFKIEYPKEIYKFSASDGTDIYLSRSGMFSECISITYLNEDSIFESFDIYNINGL